MQRMGVKPNVMTYNALINACGKSGLQQEALDAFHEMCEVR